MSHGIYTWRWKEWSQWPGLNRRPTVYETVALPLSYIGVQKHTFQTTGQRPGCKKISCQQRRQLAFGLGCSRQKDFFGGHVVGDKVSAKFAKGPGGNTRPNFFHHLEIKARVVNAQHPQAEDFANIEQVAQ